MRRGLHAAIMRAPANARMRRARGSAPVRAVSLQRTLIDPGSRHAERRRKDVGESSGSKPWVWAVSSTNPSAATSIGARLSRYARSRSSRHPPPRGHARSSAGRARSRRTGGRAGARGRRTAASSTIQRIGRSASPRPLRVPPRPRDRRPGASTWRHRRRPGPRSASRAPCTRTGSAPPALVRGGHALREPRPVRCLLREQPTWPVSVGRSSTVRPATSTGHGSQRPARSSPLGSNPGSRGATRPDHRAAVAARMRSGHDPLAEPLEAHALADVEQLVAIHGLMIAGPP